MDRDALHAAELRRFAYWSRRVAAERGLGMTELYRRTALGQGTFFSAVDAKGNPTSRTLTAIAAALDMPLRALLAPIPEADED